MRGPGRTPTTREWLESLDPAEFMEIASTISDIKREREAARRRRLEERRGAGARRNARRGGGRYLQLERVRCGKEGCKKCSSEHPELHGPYWYLSRPKKSGAEGRTSEYVGKVLPEALAREFGVPEERRGAEE